MHRRLVHMPVATFLAEAGAAVSPVATHDDILERGSPAEIESGWQHYRAALAGVLLPTDFAAMARVGQEDPRRQGRRARA